MGIDFKQIALMVDLLAEEKNLETELVHEIIEQAVAAAWRQDCGHSDQKVRSTINLYKEQIDIYIIYEVVEEVVNSHNEISLKDALAKDPNAKIGDKVEEHQVMQQLGRVAAQSAKQVILQKIRQVERDKILTEFEAKLNTIVSAIVTRVDSRLIRLEIDRARGIMPLSEQIKGEHYYIGQRIKVLLKEVERNERNPQLILSRGSTEFLHLLFKNEVPEMENNAVEIKKIVREPGVRAKIAVVSNVPNVDPVGTLVGGHGVRVKSVNNEIGEQEKIDIIVWDEDDKQYITNTLNPTKVLDIILTPAQGEIPRKALVVVANGQLNIAIGRNGQNVRLAGKITGYEIDVIDEASHKAKSEHRLVKKEQLEEKMLETIKSTSSEEDEIGDEPQKTDDTSVSSATDKDKTDADRTDEESEPLDENGESKSEPKKLDEAPLNSEEEEEADTDNSEESDASAEDREESDIDNEKSEPLDENGESKPEPKKLDEDPLNSEEEEETDTDNSEKSDAPAEDREESDIDNKE